jgi:hypothetical protein
MIDAKRIPDLLAALFVGLVLLFLAFPGNRFSGSLAGHLIGVAGTVFICMALIYPFRKRVLGKKGRQNPHTHHIYYGLLGPILVVVHSGSKAASTIGLLIYLAILAVVLSGIAGRILFVRLGRTIREHGLELELLRSHFLRQKESVAPEICLKVLAIEKDLYTKEEEEDFDSSTKAKCLELRKTAKAMVELEGIIQAYSATKTLFSFWSGVHIHAVLALFALLVVHVLTTSYYGWRWLS